MSKIEGQSVNLTAGEFYGSITKKEAVSSSIISEIVHMRGRKLPKHSHELAFFSLLLGGSYSESYGTKSFTYQPLTIWWHPQGVEHKDEVGQTGGRFFNIEIQPNRLDPLKDYTRIPNDFSERSTQLVWLACRLYHEFKTWRLGSELVADGVILEMFAYSAGVKAAVDKTPPKWLDLVIEKLEYEFIHRPTTAELASAANVHPVHLATVFRKFQNQTIGEYIQNRRVQYVSQLLLNKKIPLTEIALSAGFCDQSHFTRIFKHITGLPPGDFRKQFADL